MKAFNCRILQSAIRSAVSVKTLFSAISFLFKYFSNQLICSEQNLASETQNNKCVLCTFAKDFFNQSKITIAILRLFRKNVCGASCCFFSVLTIVNATAICCHKNTTFRIGQTDISFRPSGSHSKMYSSRVTLQSYSIEFLWCLKYIIGS